MSLRTLPILFINLGGEMLYILDQRLRAQNIAPEKGRKVMHDIISTMFKQRFVEELFKPQESYNKRAMRTVFDRLAHASIMRLNSTSMDKLYDLMTMSVKYEVCMCPRPADLLLVTLNHMDAIRDFVKGNVEVTALVEKVFALLESTYGTANTADFQNIRQSLLAFFQDMHIRVSIFLRDGLQGNNGRFVIATRGPVPHGSAPTNRIRFYRSDGCVATPYEGSAGRFEEALPPGSTAAHGDRGTRIGTNMYANSVAPASCTVTESDAVDELALTRRGSSSNADIANAELNVLASLLGGAEGGASKEVSHNLFRLNLDGASSPQKTRVCDRGNSSVLRFDATRTAIPSELAAAAAMFEEKPKEKASPAGNKGADLFELMMGED